MQTTEQFIRVEISDKKHMICSRVIGSNDAFTEVATVKNRSRAESMVKQLNKQ